MGYYPDFTSPIESDIFGSNDSLIVRHFVDSLFTGSTGLRAGERAGSVAQWSGEASPSLFTGLSPTQVGWSLPCPADTARSPPSCQLTPTSHCRRPSLSPPQTLPHPTSDKASLHITDNLTRMFFQQRWPRPRRQGAGSLRARQGLAVPTRKAAGASCRALPPGGVGLSMWG